MWRQPDLVLYKTIWSYQRRADFLMTLCCATSSLQQGSSLFLDPYMATLAIQGHCEYRVSIFARHLSDFSSRYHPEAVVQQTAIVTGKETISETPLVPL